MNFLKQKFTSRDYNNIIAHNPLEPFCNRTQYLISRVKSKPETLTIVCTLDKEKQVIISIEENWSLSTNNHNTRKNSYSKPVVFTHTNHPNIQRRLSRTKIDYTISSHNTTLYPIPNITKITYLARNITCKLLLL